MSKKDNTPKKVLNFNCVTVYAFIYFALKSQKNGI